MNKPMTLTDKMLVLADEKQTLCIYPKITRQTRNVLIVGYGAPGITEQQLKEAVETTIAYINLVSDGEMEITKVFLKK
jgi:DNA/RNA-binding domain of Phe-tRNA-synthetase-like protein